MKRDMIPCRLAYLTRVWEKCIASILGVDEKTKQAKRTAGCLTGFLSNLEGETIWKNLLPDYMVLHPRRQKPSQPLQCIPKISLCLDCLFQSTSHQTNSSVSPLSSLTANNCLMLLYSGSVVYWVVTPCSFIGAYWFFKGTCCLHL
jgi:hypothetical protein